MEARKIECPCGKHLLVQPEQGLRGKCPRCGRLFDLRAAAPARDLTPPPTRLAPPEQVPATRSRSRGALLGWISSALLALLSLVLATEWLSLSGEVSGLQERLARIEDAPAPAASAARAGTPARGDTLPAGTREEPPRATPPPEAGARAEDLVRLEKDFEALAQKLDKIARRVDEVHAGQAEDPAPPRISAGEGDFETRVMALARRVTPTIVSITNGAGTGSGVVVSADGYILTNDHVVSGASEVTVQLATGDTHKGRVLGSDSYSDIACVKIAGRDLPAIEFGDSDALSVGQVVAALGNPFGLARDGTPTVTLGIVSALHRVLPLSEDKMYRDAIQTDA
ncbi:MAG: trypsin-like peptidase domain-containing protein, partial [Planctomycetes bacterium]|nr:trypsin-like peptidase domain-containing protein [Planctomycetota bacterium]